MRRATGSRKEQPLYNDSENDDDESFRRRVPGSSAIPSHEIVSSTGATSAAVGRAVASGSRARLSESEILPAATSYHSIGLLDDSVNLPEYVKDHSTTLIFPEKVSDFTLFTTCE